MTERIKHDGVVEAIMGNVVRVRIVQTSACASCKVASNCNASEKKEKIVEVTTANAASYSVGQQVVVSASKSVANIALLLGFGLPLLLLVIGLLVALHLTGDEGVSALCALGMLIPYYFALWLLRARIGQRISFSIED